MAARILPTPEQLRELLRYEPDTGKLFWKERPVEMFQTTDRRGAEWSAKCWNSRHAGCEAFTFTDRLGYRTGGVGGRLLKAHRVAWAIYHGCWPSKFVDHVNRDPSDNRMANLREASRSQNGCNRAAQSNSASGEKGVYWDARLGKWVARARLLGKTHYLGWYSTKDEAASAYSRRISEVHGEFAGGD